MRKLTVIIDLQYGSTGKGLIAGHHAFASAPDTVVSAFAPNAGHCLVDKNNNKFVNMMLPNSAIAPSVKQVLIGPGATINPDVMLGEYQSMNEYRGHHGPFELIIHPHAAVVTQKHRDLESGPMTKIGSTKKGVGEAAIQRIRRDPDNLNIASAALRGHALHHHVTTIELYNEALDRAQKILLESAQGFGLSMYHGFYPYTTSRDVTIHQMLADAAIPFGMFDIEVVGCLRTFPIRVANRFDADGKMVGWSGPHYPDQREMDWSELGMAPELTTVTKLPRRIFTFSDLQFTEAVRMNRPNYIFVNFCNYLNTTEQVLSMVTQLDRLAAFRVCYVKWLGFGPSVNDIIDLDWYNRADWKEVVDLMFKRANKYG